MHRAYDFSRHTIQDPIHGAIMFGPLEKAIIDHRLFQRLHGLRQNSLLHLIFPSANHTRFDHSVGVMWLADKYLDSIVRNQELICQAGAARDAFQSPYRVDDATMNATAHALSDRPYFRLVLRAAALFHDIGHGPLSHLFDKFFPSAAVIRDLTSKPPYEHIHSRLSALPVPVAEAPVHHETFSCVLATRVLLDQADEIRHYELDPLQMAKDVCAIIDSHIEPGPRFESGLYRIQSLLHDIISSDLDADRMDYLLRDSHMCGVNYGLYDPDRILKSMCAYAREDTGALRVAVRHSGLGALEDLLLSRYQMHSQIYCHKTNRACDATLESIRGHLQKVGWVWHDGCRTVDQLIERFAELDDQTFIRQLQQLDGPNGREAIRHLAENLFARRKLVKRVFEERIVRSEANPDREQRVIQRWEDHQRNLDEAGIWYTRDCFENKGPKVGRPDYYLKVLRKHPKHGFYLVHELRDLSTIAHYLPEQEITYRLYCKADDVAKAKRLLPD